MPPAGRGARSGCVASRRVRRHAGPVSRSGTGSARERTYGIWGFVAVFAAMSLVGVVLLLFGGGSSSGTEVVPTPQTLPEQLADPGRSNDTAPDTDPDADTGTAEGDGERDPVVGGTAGGSADGDAADADDTPMTDDTDLPPGVAQVMRDEGIVAYLFEVPPGVDAEGTTPAVAPMRVQLADDGRSATVSVGCAVSSQEFLAQIAIAPGDTAVTFTAVALVPTGATAPCDPAAPARTVEVTLDEPVGQRAVVVVPSGTDVPQLSAG